VVNIRVKEVYRTEALLAQVGNDAKAVGEYVELWKKEEGRWKLF
jgi:hypothetical protein